MRISDWSSDGCSSELVRENRTTGVRHDKELRGAGGWKYFPGGGGQARFDNRACGRTPIGLDLITRVKRGCGGGIALMRAAMWRQIAFQLSSRPSLGNYHAEDMTSASDAQRNT